MRVIWKFEITGKPIQMPRGSVLVDFAMQNDCMTAWFIVDTRAENVSYEFQVFATGQEIPDGALYVASLQDKPFVWHLFLMN